MTLIASVQLKNGRSCRNENELVKGKGTIASICGNNSITLEEVDDANTCNHFVDKMATNDTITIVKDVLLITKRENYRCMKLYINIALGELLCCNYIFRKLENEGFASRAFMYF